MKNLSGKLIKWGIGFFIVFIVLILLNPFGYNSLGYREVVESPTGGKKVVFKSGFYWKMPGSKVTRYPNLVTMDYSDTQSESTVNRSRAKIRFLDATTGMAEIIVKYKMPDAEELQLKIHEDFNGSLSHFANTGLAPYTLECLKNTAQLMESEQHYSGGRSKFSNDFRDQLDYGYYIVDLSEETIIDSTTNETKRIYRSEIRKNANELPERGKNDLKEYGILIASQNVVDVDYEEQVDQKLKKKIEASTRESVSKQNLITAQQEAMTAQAEGKRKLVEIEYQEKQKQTQLIVQAETQVRLAEKDKEKQRIALEAAKLEAAKIKELAEAEAFAKQRIMQADGALEKKLAAYQEVQKLWAGAFAQYQGAIVPQIQTGGNGTAQNGGLDFMQLMSMKAAKDLNLDMNVKNVKK